MSQDGKTVTMNGDCGSNNKMTNDIKNGMVFAISSWSTYDNWLWKSRCQAQGCNGSDLTFSNLKIKTGGSSPTPGPTPGPTPTPGNYTFGDKCSSNWADECHGCGDCRWSWPSNESWSSPNAKCRCK
jgi:hypothetical protein